MKLTQFLTALFLIVTLNSCSVTKNEITPSPSTSLLATSTQEPSFSPSTTATLVNSPFPQSTQPDEQVYVDPEGWFSVALPAKWKKDKSPSYEGNDGFFETGYLPELGFVPYELNVCEWIANIQTKNLYTVSWVGKQGCQLFSRSGSSPATTWEIIENPSADFAHRFLYIKADPAHFGRIASTFTWLRTVDAEGKPDFRKSALRPEDIAFWDNTSSIPSTLSLKEYALPPEYQGEDPSKKIFLDLVPPEALPTQSPIHGTYSPTTLESVNQSLTQHGYELRQLDVAYLYDLYQNDERVIQNVYRLPEVYVFPIDDSGKLIFFAHTLVDPNQSPYTKGNVVSYLVQDEKILLWEKALLNPMLPGWTPILVEDKPLFLGLGDGITLQVLNLQHEPIFSFATYFGTHVPIKQFRSWQNHWILEVSNFVVQDGDILNEKYNFEEVFDWSLIDDKPFYFFRKGPRSGFSYDGQFFSTYYNEIVHGYCCGLAANNPRIKDNTLRFFGKRDEVWYYVVLEIQ